MEIKSAPYNVVLDDDTFKGELKVGLRFIATVSNSRTILENWNIMIFFCSDSLISVLSGWAHISYILVRILLNFRCRIWLSLILRFIQFLLVLPMTYSLKISQDKTLFCRINCRGKHGNWRWRPKTMKNQWFLQF